VGGGLREERATMRATEERADRQPKVLPLPPKLKLNSLFVEPREEFVLLILGLAE